MNSETYTPGHTHNAVAFMMRRSLDSHGQFFRAHLQPGLQVLDCGCGPGTISLDIAAAVAPGAVTGVDFGQSQIDAASQAAAARGISNTRFVQGSAYELPFADGSFDRVFSHALLEHLAQPARALAEFFRVLRPGGVLGVCTPDVGGLLVAPVSPELNAAILGYNAMQKDNGGDLEIGRRLGALLGEAGFEEVHMSARYECHPPRIISEYLGLQLQSGGLHEHAAELHKWSGREGALFAQPWLSATGRKP